MTTFPANLPVRRFAVVFATLCLTFALVDSRARADDTAALKNVKLLLSEIDSVAPQIQKELALYREQIRAGLEKDGWTEERKVAALQAFDEMLLPNPNPRPDATDIQKIMTPGLGRLMSVPRGYPAARTGAPRNPPAELSDWLARRIRSLMNYRTSLAFQCASELAPFAEEIWIHAKSPADLKPAAAAFAEVIKRDPQFVLQPAFGMKGRPMVMPGNSSDPVIARMSNIQRIRNDAFEIWLLTASDEPLFLPESETDPEGFWKAREIWLALRRANVSFPSKPQPAAHFNALNRRFQDGAMAAQQQVTQAILDDVPTDQFEQTLKRLHAFEPLYFNLRTGPPGSGGSGMWIRNFHELLARSQLGVSMNHAISYPTPEEKKQAEDLSAMLQSFDALLELRRAEEAGVTGEKMSDLKEHVQRAQANFPEAVKLHLARWAILKTDQKSETAADPKTDELPANPVKDLISELKKLSTSGRAANGTDSPGEEDVRAAMTAQAVKLLLNAWLGAAQSAPVEPGMDAAEAWRTIASQPGWLNLFDLRDRAGRFLLAQIVGTKPAPGEQPKTLSEFIRRALQDTVAGGDWKKAHAILTLDSATGALPRGESAHWERAIENFAAADASVEKDPQQARALFVQILGSESDPACTDLAVQRLKKFSAPDAQH